MERTNRGATTRRSKTNARSSRGMYVDGNTVRRLEERPSRQQRGSKEAQIAKRKATRPASQTERKNRQVSRETQRNREKAMSMGRGFVFFLAVVSVAVLFWYCSISHLFVSVNVLILSYITVAWYTICLFLVICRIIHSQTSNGDLLDVVKINI